MPVITKSKTNDQNYLNIKPEELDPALEAELREIHADMVTLAIKRGDFARHLAVVFPQYAGLPLGFAFSKLSIALDAEPREPRSRVAKPKQSLAEFVAAQSNGGRAM
jgi:hypothetical protein